MPSQCLTLLLRMLSGLLGVLAYPGICYLSGVPVRFMGEAMNTVVLGTLVGALAGAVTRSSLQSALLGLLVMVITINALTHWLVSYGL